MAGTNEIFVFKDALIVLGTAAVVVPVVHRLKISPDPRLPRRRGRARAARPRPSRRVFARHRLVHRHRRAADRLHRRPRHRLPAVLHRPRTVDAPPAHHAPAGVRAGRPAGPRDGRWRSASERSGVGQPPAAALIIGTCLALSSTAIVMELLSGQRRMMSTTGRTSFAILLAQDLAVVPLLFLISALGGRAEGGSMVQDRGRGAGRGGDRRRRHRRRRPRRAEAVVPAGRRHRQSGILHGRHPADLRRLRRGRGLCRPVDGARRLHRRPAAGGDRVPPRRRGDDRPVPRPAAGRVLLLGRHAHRSRLHLAQAAAGGGASSSP